MKNPLQNWSSKQDSEPQPVVPRHVSLGPYLPWTSDAHRLRGLAGYMTELYGVYLTSGVIMNFVDNPVTGQLPDLVTKSTEMVRTFTGVALSLPMDIPWYLAQLFLKGSYDVVFGEWREVFGALKDYGVTIWQGARHYDLGDVTHALVNTQPFHEHLQHAPNLVDLLHTATHFATLTIPRHNTVESLQWLDKYSINPVTGAIGLGVVGICEYMRHRRRGHKLYPISGNAKPLHYKEVDFHVGY